MSAAHAIVDVLLENEGFEAQAAQATNTKQECAWCNGEKGLQSTPGSHGICKRHWAGMMREAGMSDATIQARLSDPNVAWTPERTA